jgi:ResB-like family
MTASPRWKRLWALCCSLKLAIVLASLATLLTMGGSLVIHFLPGVFGALDQHPLGEWFLALGRLHPALSSWLLLLVGLMFLLAVNTLCCLLDWLSRLRSRWRKSGEYLLHLGFVLIVGAYLWGALAGVRQPGLALGEGQTVALAKNPGVYLRLDHFDPVFRDGRPIDMRSTVTVLQGDEPQVSKVIHINHPLLWRDLVILPESFGQRPDGFRFLLAGRGEVDLVAGSRLPLGTGGELQVLDFLPDARVDADGRVVPRGGNLGDPAFRLRLLAAGRPIWQGWYALRQGLPPQLAGAGVLLRPLEPHYRTVSILTVNRDPGAHLALAGAAAMLLGVCLALASFYRKRAHGDRPDIK